MNAAYLALHRNHEYVVDVRQLRLRLKHEWEAIGRRRRRGTSDGTYTSSPRFGTLTQCIVRRVHLLVVNRRDSLELSDQRLLIRFVQFIIPIPFILLVIRLGLVVIAI